MFVLIDDNAWTGRCQSRTKMRVHLKLSMMYEKIEWF
jgi:hypothetical protein